jgi:type IV fimbrial biogenesis protein FimT
MRQLTHPLVQTRGVTLIELVVTLLLLALLLMMAAPAMAEFLRNGKLREGSNAVMSALLFTRNEAIKRNEAMSLRITGAELVVQSAGGDVLRRQRLSDAVSAALTTPDGAAADPPQVTYSGAGRTVPMGVGFKVDMALADATCSDTLRCARVMVRAGGAVRLCKDLVDC